MKAVLTIGYECNNQCLSCGPPERGRVPSLTLQEIESRLGRLRQAGIATIILNGGEPAIRRDFFSITAAIRDQGLQVGLRTNGRIFSYADFAEKYVRLDPETTQILIYSHDPEVHDRIAGVPGAFAQTVRGIRNIAGKLRNVTVCVPVNRHNTGCIRETPDLLWRLGLRARVKFDARGFECDQDAGASQPPPDIEPIANSVADALAYGIRRHAHHGITFCAEGLAPCLIRDFSDYGTDSLTEDVALAWDAEAPDFHVPALSVDAGDAYEECLVCSRRTDCFAPHRQVRSSLIGIVRNAAGYDFTSTLSPAGHAPCPAGDSVCSNLHPLKDAAVLMGGKLDVFRADGHCGSHAMREARFTKEQVYLNTTGHTRNLDFRTAFRRLVLHHACRDCVRRHTRSGVYVPAPGASFAAVEAAEKAWLEGISGRILDVGCGRPLFPDLLREKISSGQIEYLGVDRRPECPAGLQAVSEDFEAFAWDGPAFDHVMMLRSYNHFRDPRPVLDKAAGLLKPGGLLHIFENGLFAMLKKNMINEPARGDEPEHQHFRNHWSEDVLKLVSLRGGFEPIHHTPVAPGTANQWFVTFRRIQAP